jgi:hypothetical protein
VIAVFVSSVKDLAVRRDSQPIRASCYSQRHDNDVFVRPREQPTRPLAKRRLALDEREQRRTRAVGQVLVKVLIATIADAEQRSSPPVAIWRGFSLSHAAISRPRSTARASPTAAASAVALIVPIRGIVISRRTAPSFRAIRTSPASKAAMRL